MARILNFQDISWFLDLYEKDQIDLNPPYQRRSVWSPRDRRYFIDTILNDYPAPPVFLHKTLDENGKATYHVVDGKQRLQTIFNFTKDKVRIPDDFGTAALQGKRWKDLDRPAREQFWNYIMIVEMLPDASEASIRSTFERINRNARKLSPQELRHAKYDGWFITTAEREVERHEWKDFGIATTARSKRMFDVQFVSELMQITIKQKLFGFDQDNLDSLYADYDDLAEVEDFSEDEFRTDFDAIREYVKAMIAAEANLVPYIRIQLHLYTLWGYLSASENRERSAAEFAPIFKQFLDDVQTHTANPLAPEAEADANRVNYLRAVADYALNARGASTDLVQRVSRHKAAITAMSGVEPFPDEGQ